MTARRRGRRRYPRGASRAARRGRGRGGGGDGDARSRCDATRGRGDVPARAGASPAATRGRSRRRARTQSTSSASPNEAPATPGAEAARRATAWGDSDNSSQRPRASVVIRWKGHQNERRHSTRRNPRENPPTTPSTPAPPHPLPPPQAPSPPSTARGPAVRDARRGRRARDVGVSSRTAHPTGEPTGARPRARAYEGEATRNNVVGGAGPVPNQVSVCLSVRGNVLTVFTGKVNEEPARP